MIRRSVTRRLNVPFVNPCDFLFPTPQFDPCALAGLIPETEEARKRLMSNEKNESGSVITHLRRGCEILDSLGKENAEVVKELRAASAALCRALYSVPVVGEHEKLDVSKVVLDVASAALKLPHDDESNLATRCELGGWLTRAYCEVNAADENEKFIREKPSAGAIDAQQLRPLFTSLATETVALKKFPKPVSRDRGREASEKTAEDVRFWSWTAVRMRLLEALIVIPTTGRLDLSQTLVQGLSRDVSNWRRRQPVVTQLLWNMDDTSVISWDPCDGLLMAISADIRARQYDWFDGPLHVDQTILDQYDGAIKYLDELLRTADKSLYNEGTACLVSVCLAAAQFLLSAPNAEGDKSIFNRLCLSSSPFITVKSGAQFDSSHTFERRALPRNARLKLAQGYLERAATLNRTIVKSNAEDLRGMHIIRGLAVLFSESRDFVHATGMFEACDKAATLMCGAHSSELRDNLYLRHTYESTIGALQEARVTRAKIDAISSWRASHGLQ